MNRPLDPAPPRLCAHLLMIVILALPLSAGCEIKDMTEPPPADSDPPAEAPERPQEPPAVEVVTGSDYWLPDWVEPEEFAGYVDHPDPDLPGNDYRNVWTNWAELEPEPGQYDWSPITGALSAAEASGRRICLHILCVTWGGGDPDRGVEIPRTVPDWVPETFGLTEDDIIDLGGEWGLEVIPGWRPEIRARFDALLAALGRSGLPQREALGAAYIHGISPSRGEEFWLDQPRLDRLEARGDFDADVLATWFTERIDAYAAAFAGVEHKLAWVGTLGIWRWCAPDYEAAVRDLIQHAWDVGAGIRSGIVEKYNVWLEEPALGQSVDDAGYLHTDETIPPIAEGRYLGNENEAYGDAWTWLFGGRQGEAVRYRLSMLRALQMQVRFLWTDDAAETLDPGLSRYARFAFGKRVENSPDAWCYLRESAVGRHITPAGVVKNLERWLLQRDVPGGMTVPTERVDRTFNAGSIGDGEAGAYHDLLARRTDRSAGQPSIYFDLDDRFDPAGPVQIKVEIRDDSTATWHLEFEGSDGSLEQTSSFTGLGDGAVRTVTFTLDGARFSGGLDHGMDFRIMCTGPGDVIVRWVRLVRLQRP